MAVTYADRRGAELAAADETTAMREEIAKLRREVEAWKEEAGIWKGRYEAERHDHDASIKAFNETLRD